MIDLSGYGLRDFLMFSPEVYFRLFERYNAALWPAHVGAAAMALLLVWLARDSAGRRGRAVTALLALSWASIAWWFFHRYYANIFLAAPYFAVGFAVQAVSLLAAGLLNRGVQSRWRGWRQGGPGAALLFFAVFVHPFIGPLAGRSWSGAELFGLAPDPTALGTLGLLLMAGGRVRWLLVPVPVLWCAVSGLTYYAMGYHAGLVTPVAALAALVFGPWKR